MARMASSRASRLDVPCAAVCLAAPAGEVVMLHHAIVQAIANIHRPNPLRGTFANIVPPEPSTAHAGLQRPNGLGFPVLEVIRLAQGSRPNEFAYKHFFLFFAPRLRLQLAPRDCTCGKRRPAPQSPPSHGASTEIWACSAKERNDRRG